MDRKAKWQEFNKKKMAWKMDKEKTLHQMFRRQNRPGSHDRLGGRPLSPRSEKDMLKPNYDQARSRSPRDSHRRTRDGNRTTRDGNRRAQSMDSM